MIENKIKPKKDYITNIHIIKQEPQSKNENGFLKDHIDEQPKSSYDNFILEIDILIWKILISLKKIKKN